MKYIDKLLNPTSIALIGASSNPSKVGNIILKNLIEQKWRGKIYPVNPNEKEILGIKVYPDVNSLPDGIDIALIALNATLTVNAAKECVQKGIKIIIPVAGGFSETDEKGKKLEDEMRQYVISRGGRILGPNTLGVFIPGTGFDTIFVEHGDKMFSKPGEVAFITQSGSVGVEALGYAGTTGFGLRAFVGLGNRTDISENEFIDYFANDSITKCIAFYLETFANGREFIEKCAKVTPNKPVVVLKAGRSEASAKAVASHTGRIATTGKVFFGACKQYGLTLAYNEEELTDFSKILAREPLPKGNKVAIVSPAGGFAIIALDLISESSLLAPATLSDETVHRIKEKVLPFASVHNPIDLTASCDDKMVFDTLSEVAKDPNVDIILTIAFYSPPALTTFQIDMLIEFRKKVNKPFVVYTTYGPYTYEIVKRLYEGGIVAFTSLRRAIRSIEILVERSNFLKKLEKRERLKNQ